MRRLAREEAGHPLDLDVPKSSSLVLYFFMDMVTNSSIHSYIYKAIYIMFSSFRICGTYQVTLSDSSLFNCHVYCCIESPFGWRGGHLYNPCPRRELKLFSIFHCVKNTVMHNCAHVSLDSPGEFPRRGILRIYGQAVLMNIAKLLFTKLLPMCSSQQK